MGSEREGLSTLTWHTEEMLHASQVHDGSFSWTARAHTPQSVDSLSLSLSLTHTHTTHTHTHTQRHTDTHRNTQTHTDTHRHTQTHALVRRSVRASPGRYTTPWPAQSAWFSVQSSAVALQMLKDLASCALPSAVDSS
jgi:hypothetical protein